MTGLAHESRNALQRSQACIEMLAKRAGGDREAEGLLARLQEAQEDLHHLYETVRDYAAPLRLDRRTRDLREVVSAAWAELELARRTRKATLEIRADGVDARCRVDAFALRRALANVLENAVGDGAADTGAARRIEVELAAGAIAGKPSVAIRITDDGPGLAPGEELRIFEPFYTTRARGTGLGLAITKRIIEAHGGTIAARPGPWPGACIEVTLPRS